MNKKLYKFIQFYLCSFKYLKHISEDEKYKFIEWFLDKGNNNFNNIIKNLNVKKGHIIDGKKVIDYYNFILRNSINNKDWELYINWMYSIPTSLNSKFKEMKLI